MKKYLIPISTFIITLTIFMFLGYMRGVDIWVRCAATGDIWSGAVMIAALLAGFSVLTTISEWV